jgi:hypothetical protein
MDVYPTQPSPAQPSPYTLSQRARVSKCAQNAQHNSITRNAAGQRSSPTINTPQHTSPYLPISLAGYLPASRPRCGSTQPRALSSLSLLVDPVNSDSNSAEGVVRYTPITRTLVLSCPALPLPPGNPIPSSPYPLQSNLSRRRSRSRSRR